MAEPGEHLRRRDVACPFCGLGCDDLEIEREAERLLLRHGACPISKVEFERVLPTQAAARVAGAPTDHAAAVAAAAEILRRSRMPVVGGLATDIDGMRGALELADRTGAVIDHRGSEALFRDLTALRDIGTMTTTFSEVRNRCDLLLIVGPDPLPTVPRFLERCLADRPTLFEMEPAERRLIHLGPAPGAAQDRLTHIPCSAKALAPTLAKLRAILRRPASASGVEAALTELAAKLKGARYAVIAWSAALLPAADADLIILCLVEIIRELNRVGRAAGLPLGGAENLTGANQACLWQTGHPLRTSFGAASPRHDPYLYSAARLIAGGEADALVWVAAFGGSLPPPLPPEAPLILLATPDAAPAIEPAVFLPVGRPGIDHAGQIFRADGVVALPLGVLRESVLPRAGDTLRDIARAFEAAAP